MGYVLKWGNRTWIYGLALGLGFGMAILLLMHNMVGAQFFFNYYSPMLGYYVLISICQSHYFRRRPEPDMGGLFRQFVSIFGAIVIFFVNQLIMVNVLGVPTADAGFLYHGSYVMSGHFTFIVFGFFIYGFDDFMFQGKLVNWIKKDLWKAVFWYFFIWAIWLPLYYMKGGLVQAYSVDAFNDLYLYAMLGISQWTIIMSLMIALTFKDYLPEIRIENPYAKGLVLLGGSVVAGTAIALICLALTHYIAPWDDLHMADKWHHVLYMGTYPLTPVILMGVYSNNFKHVKDPGNRVFMRILYLVPIVVLSYFGFHFLIAQPDVPLNWVFGKGTFADDMGFFGELHWHHHLDLYFNFTVSIIPLTHHWFCGKAGFVVEEGEEETGPPETRRVGFRQTWEKGYRPPLVERDTTSRDRRVSRHSSFEGRETPRSSGGLREPGARSRR